MTKEEKSKIKYRMKHLARKFCRRNDVYERFGGTVVGDLIEKAYFSAYLMCLHENKHKIEELKKESDFYHIEKGNYKADFFRQVIATNKVNRNLTKAKEIITKLLQRTPDFKANSFSDLLLLNALSEAEQFLKETKEND